MGRIALALAFLCAGGALAQGDRFHWRTLGRVEGLPSEDVYDLCTSGPDRVWAATAGGLCRIEAYEFRLLGPMDQTPRLVAAAADGGVYALYPKGIAWIREGAEEWIEPPADAARVQPTAIASEPDGTLWILTGGSVYSRRPGGGFVRDPSRSDLKSLGPPPPNPRYGKAPYQMHAMIRHRDEVWGATRGQGILRQRLTARFRGPPRPGGLRVHALAEGPDGSIWCATEAGLTRIRGDETEVIASIDGKPLGTVTGCAVDREGRVWIGSGSSFTGVYRLDGAGWSHKGEIDAYVHRITTDPTGAVWFAVLNREGGPAGEGEGAWYYSGGKFQPAPMVGDFPSGRVYDVVARDPSGVLWFATLKGLAAYEGGGRLSQYTPETGGLPGEKVWCLCAARDGSLWIGYQSEHGASRLARGEVTHFDVEDGLCDGNVWSIAEGRPGVFWFATQSGLSRFDGRRWSCFRAEEELGVAPIWPLLPLADGSLWIGTLGEGAVHLVPDDRSPPRTRFDAVRYEGPAGRSITVSWSGHDAWFDTPSADLWYRWRLDDGGWSKATPKRSLTLDPPEGVHRLEVQAIDRFGNAEDPPQGVEILVRGGGAPWLLYALGAALLVALGFLIGRRGSAARAT